MPEMIFEYKGADYNEALDQLDAIDKSVFPKGTKKKLYNTLVEFKDNHHKYTSEIQESFSLSAINGERADSIHVVFKDHTHIEKILHGKGIGDTEEKQVTISKESLLKSFSAAQIQNKASLTEQSKNTMTTKNAPENSLSAGLGFMKIAKMTISKSDPDNQLPRMQIAFADPQLNEGIVPYTIEYDIPAIQK